jgi:hypothetical protein
MNIRPLYQKVNGVDYWVGFSEGGADVQGKDAVAVPDETLASVSYFDAYGNPQAILAADGTVSYSPVSATAKQISDKADADRVAKLLPQLGPLLAKAIKGTAGPDKSWPAFDAAVRELLNGNGGKT